ncbi:MAG: hypothetical protein NW220_21770 [Leptolyngbyaceae cyanobacterium bins.349]|nr:hypothetical protein [Leptolyngbyaceae cyanobacterium bins.349]
MKTDLRQEVEARELLSDSIESLTRTLQEIIQELEIDTPQTISISFDGTEVYQYHTHEAKVYWWGTDAADVS